MIIMTWVESMFVWLLSVCSSMFFWGGRDGMGLLDGSGGCVWEGSSSWRAFKWFKRAHMIKGQLPCGGKDPGQGWQLVVTCQSQTDVTHKTVMIIQSHASSLSIFTTITRRLPRMVNRSLECKVGVFLRTAIAFVVGSAENLVGIWITMRQKQLRRLVDTIIGELWRDRGLEEVGMKG